jgi:transcriptional regulator GlxA family with amidase domain
VQQEIASARAALNGWAGRGSGPQDNSKRLEKLAAFRLKRVVDFVESRLSGSLALADLASVAGGSVFHFSRAFRNTAGDTPYRYVLRRRVELAKSLLVRGDASVAAVARECGFSCPANFAKTFSRFVGATPKRYRRSQAWVRLECRCTARASATPTKGSSTTASTLRTIKAPDSNAPNR